ncbi:MAG: hypothetical protein HKN19_00195 [Halioglobus sp.]|nr:hypothetical protein [Halioglobus sp.]
MIAVGTDILRIARSDEHGAPIMRLSGAALEAPAPERRRVAPSLADERDYMVACAVLAAH